MYNKQSIFDYVNIVYLIKFESDLLGPNCWLLGCVAQTLEGMEGKQKKKERAEPGQIHQDTDGDCLVACGRQTLG